MTLEERNEALKAELCNFFPHDWVVNPLTTEARSQFVVCSRCGETGWEL